MSAQVTRRRLCAAAVLSLLAWLAVCAAGRAQAPASAPAVQAAAILDLVRAAAGPEVTDCYAQVLRAGFPSEQFSPDDILAFEEHRLFVFAAGESRERGPVQTAGGAESSPRRMRRVIVLKPATVVIEDHVRSDSPEAPCAWAFSATSRPEVAGGAVRISVGDRELLIEPLLLDAGAKEQLSMKEHKADGQYVVEVQSPGQTAERHAAFVLHVRKRGESAAAAVKVSRADGWPMLALTTDKLACELLLPSWSESPGEIQVARVDGEKLLDRRLLPAGVLPHGPEGARLLERWDAAYRGGRRAAWDTGRPSSDLKQAVEEGTLRPCRVVELGCGTGTNAIYLAGKGFDVTAIDIAPTALNLAREKAAKAGVKVRWLLADVLAPPRLEPFDLIYDRGCYHGVRRQHAAGYAAAVKRLSQPGTRLLILAGNAKEAGGGPPRVKEEELRADFSPDWDFEWLRETHFDTFDADRKGALAWSALLRRRP